ncbi:MAG: DNA/RNA helicase domain-containing protein [Betaproteobacteria bacterium]
MSEAAYYEADVSTFFTTNENEVLGELAAKHRFDLENEQRHAWQQQIRILKTSLSNYGGGRIYFEFSIPRMGKRADVVLLIEGVVFVIEFKVGAATVNRASIEQVHDYALDLKNFHKGSHHVSIVPIVLPTGEIKLPAPTLIWADDNVATPLAVAPLDLAETINAALSQKPAAFIDHFKWSHSGYQPTPTIVEAAQALYRNHDVSEISRSDADAKNLGRTSDRINEIIEHAKATRKKTICFVTGVPGAGKTLAGLNIATNRVRGHSDEHAVFLSGNGPLVDVMREALARDQSTRDGIPKKDAARRVSAFVQNIHHFRDEALRDAKAPNEKVVIFDEAQRAWNRTQASKFMKQKRDHADFDMSEPAFLVSVMDRHVGWCVVICLIGGGQEINTGEAGLAEWIKVMGAEFTHWDVHVSNRLEDPDYIWDEDTSLALKKVVTTKDESLHLGVSMRSFRAESLSAFIGHVLENRPDQAREAYSKIADRYPIKLSRDLGSVRKWLRENARGSERYGLVASSGANRLRPEGIFIKSAIDAPVWFLNDCTDVRSSFYLEEVASEFDVQGLELDWAGVCWDADYRFESGEWKHYSFRGTKWQRSNAPEKRLFLKNAYRVILTRARQGMVIFVPLGSPEDPTRPAAFYDPTYEYLRLCGVPDLPFYGAPKER